MTNIYFQLRYIQTFFLRSIKLKQPNMQRVNKKLFLTSLLFLARSYRDVQHTNFRM